MCHFVILIKVWMEKLRKLLRDLAITKTTLENPTQIQFFIQVFWCACTSTPAKPNIYSKDDKMFRDKSLIPLQFTYNFIYWECLLPHKLTWAWSIFACFRPLPWPLTRGLREVNWSTINKKRLYHVISRDQRTRSRANVSSYPRRFLAFTVWHHMWKAIGSIEILYSSDWLKVSIQPPSQYHILMANNTADNENLNHQLFKMI